MNIQRLETEWERAYAAWGKSYDKGATNEREMSRKAYAAYDAWQDAVREGEDA
jgi:hypothetical protein